MIAITNDEYKQKKVTNPKKSDLFDIWRFTNFVQPRNNIILLRRQMLNAIKNTIKI
jgi:hypothetical protein